MASIAANERIAAVDANVMRIFARLRCLAWELKAVKQYSLVAEQVVDPVRPGDFNQAGLINPWAHNPARDHPAIVSRIGFRFPKILNRPR